MILGVVSDTHGHVDFALPAARILESMGVQTVLHCGDIGSPAIVPLFSAWPTHFVFGNVDNGLELKEAIEQAGQACYGRFGQLELAGVRIAFLHGDDEELLSQTIQAERYQLVCHGHTHVPRSERFGRTWVVIRVRCSAPHTIAIVQLPELKADIIVVD